MPGAGIDSLRAIVHRDLDYSDRFEMVADIVLRRRFFRRGHGSGELRDL